MTDIKIRIELNGVRQRIHVVTQDEKKPVLLFLHGGPGVCNRHSLLRDHIDLTDTFTLATWDQRGTGGSYYGVRRETLTAAQLTKDAADLAAWLCERFHKKKIFVIGGSWGSQLLTMLARDYPEHLAAAVGFGQVVDGELNEKISYEFALDAAREAGDQKSIDKLEQIGPPKMGEYRGGFSGMMIQRRIMMKYGGYSRDKAKRSYFRAMIVPIIKSREYSLRDLYGLARGYKRVLSAMWHEVGHVKFPETHTVFTVPFFIFDGRHDMNTPSVLVQDWYDMIEAPRKELVWFEDSGHNPMNDEPEKFKRLLRERLTEIAAQEAGNV
ncbi:MAG TPA: alpha/beta hydrolase [Bacillota bacterium]|nr:alpha/beta hydrolase [Bacillota bacterium]